MGYVPRAGQVATSENLNCSTAETAWITRFGGADTARWDALPVRLLYIDAFYCVVRDEAPIAAATEYRLSFAIFSVSRCTRSPPVLLSSARPSFCGETLIHSRHVPQGGITWPAMRTLPPKNPSHRINRALFVLHLNVSLQRASRNSNGSNPVDVNQQEGTTSNWTPLVLQLSFQRSSTS